jgi:hypothetical protein
MTEHDWIKAGKERDMARRPLVEWPDHDYYIDDERTSLGTGLLIMALVIVFFILLPLAIGGLLISWL